MVITLSIMHQEPVRYQLPTKLLEIFVLHAQTVETMKYVKLNQ